MHTAAQDAPTFARLLRRSRRSAGLTQHELAERSGVSARSISDLERGINRHPQRETAAMLASGLHLGDEERGAFLDVARRPVGTRAGSITPLLPRPVNLLLGRDNEIQAITEALIDDRVQVLTLTGPGGVGKTRLAVEAAHLLANKFDDGIAFVRLDGLHDPALVVPAIAGVFQLQESGSRRDIFSQLSAYLAGHDVLVILDNLEHLLPAVSDLAELVAQVPHAQFLVTSRESPRITGERVLAVTPLPRPDLGVRPSHGGSDDPRQVFAAVQLFVLRALDRHPQLEVDPETPAGRSNLASIAQICHRLDGLPLAIELAAAQTEVLSPAAILSLLDEASLPLLASGNRDQPARLQTMEAAIGWSYAQLGEDEQAIFRALAIFAGGFTLTAAERVAKKGSLVPDAERGNGASAAITSSPSADFVRVITSFARRNLIFQDETAPESRAPRFRMLEPLRLFALDRLRASEEEASVRRRHAVYFAEAAEALDALTLGPDPEVWFDEQARELDNLRTAQDWALAAGNYELAAQIVAYVAQFWLLRGLHLEGRQRLEAVIAMDAAVTPQKRWFLRFWAAIFAFDSGDRIAAGAYTRELLEIASSNGDQIGIGAGLTLLSQVAGSTLAGREEALKLARSAVDTLDPLGHDEWTASAWARLGIELQAVGRVEEAREHFLHSLALRRRIGCDGCSAYSLVLLGAVYSELGRPREAVAAFRECLMLAVKHGNQPLTIRSLLGLADVAWMFGAGTEPEQPAFLFFGAAEAVRRRHGFAWDPAGAEVVEHWTATLQRTIGAPASDQAIDRGMALPMEAVLERIDQLNVAPRPSAGVARREAPALLAALGSIE